MLKRRIIPIELLDGERLVKTINFSSPRDVGDPIKSSKVYSDQDADELLLINISRESRDIDILVKVVNQISQECFVPLTVGGGVKHLDDAVRLFAAGADKILLNSAAYYQPRLISQIGERYGRQAVVVAIDVRVVEDKFFLFSDCGRKLEKTSLSKHIATVTDAGASELVVQSIDNDGIMMGYQLNLVQSVINMSSIPVIVAGGAGAFDHLKKVFDLGVDAVACGSLFNFGDNNPLRAKAYLKNYNIPLKKI